MQQRQRHWSRASCHGNAERCLLEVFLEGEMVGVNWGEMESKEMKSISREMGCDPSTRHLSLVAIPGGWLISNLSSYLTCLHYM